MGPRTMKIMLLALLLAAKDINIVNSTGDVALYPQGRVPVCVEDTLPEFECTLAPGRQLLEWRMNIMLENETMVDSYSRLLDTSGQVQRLTAHSIVFIFATPAISPLTSTLSISGMTRNLTSIEVICVDRAEQTSSSALLKVINSDMLPKPEVMNLTIQSVQQDDNGIDIIITLHWRESAYQDLFHYSVNIFPNQTSVLLSSNSTCIKLRVFYDTLYNVSMVAAPRCGHPQNSTPLNIGILYPDCGELDSSHKNSSYVYQDVQGTVIPNQCSGNNVAAHPTFSYDISQNNSITVTKSMSEITTAVLVSSIMSTALFTFIITFIIGCTCGVCFVKRCQTPRDDGSHSHDMYEVVMHHHSERTDNEPQQDVELQQNVAYAPIGANQ